MARPVRIQYPGAVYHVMARGNHGQVVFGDDTDRKRFLETLGEACEKTGWRIHAYVLMGNHYHLLVETPEPNLVAGMKWLQGTYTQRYNGRHRLFGHLFQGRYKAVIVDGRQEESYFQVVSTYIHLNPARAGLIRVGQERLKRYRWSSYPRYLNRAGRRPVWLSTAQVMGSLRLGPQERHGYEAYIESRVLELGTKAGRKELEAQWKSLRRGWYVGGHSFLDKLGRYLDGGKRVSPIIFAFGA
jgi:putative transposase